MHLSLDFAQLHHHVVRVLGFANVCAPVGRIDGAPFDVAFQLFGHESAGALLVDLAVRVERLLVLIEGIKTLV